MSLGAGVWSTRSKYGNRTRAREGDGESCHFEISQVDGVCSGQDEEALATSSDGVEYGTTFITRTLASEPKG